jgi:GGDEF domain-containing protein
MANIAVPEPDHEENGGFDTANLVACADAAMYAAKHAGRNQVVAA